MKHEKEKDYINRILAGDVNLYGYFLNTYSDAIHMLIFQIVNDSGEAEELAQDTFIKAYDNLSKFKSDSKFSTWLYRIAYNCAISHVRKKHKEVYFLQESEFERACASNEYAENGGLDDPFNCGGEEDRVAQLMAAIEKLSSQEKALITLFYYDDRSVKEIAAIIDKTESNVKTALHRTRKRLLELISEMSETIKTDYCNE